MKRIIQIISLICIGLSIGYALTWVFDSRFEIQSIEIEGSTYVRGLQKYVHTNLVFLSSDSEAAHLIRVNPTLKSIQVVKKYPHILKIRVLERTAGARIQLADARESMIISTDMHVLRKESTNEEDTLPLLRYYQPLYENQFQVGDVLDTHDLETALESTFKLSTKGIQISSIDIANENMIVLSAEDFDVYISSKRNVDDQIEALVYTYKELQKSGREFRSIDVRFDKPIIKIP